MTVSKSRLCVDIDNVIAQTDRVMRELIQEYTGGRVNLQYRHIRDFDYAKCRDDRGQQISGEEWHAIHRLFSRSRLILAIKPYPSIHTILRRLSERYELHFATSRLPEARKATVEWLEEQHFPPHRLHFLIRGEKHSALGRFRAAIEDDAHQAAKFAAIGTRCYVLAHPWNRAVKRGRYIERATNWRVIERALLATARSGEEQRGEARGG